MQGKHEGEATFRDMILHANFGAVLVAVASVTVGLDY